MQCHECLHCGNVYSDEEQAEGCCGPHSEEIPSDNLGPCPDCSETWFKKDSPSCQRCHDTQVIEIANPVQCVRCKGTGRIEDKTSSWDCPECEGWGHKDGD